MFQDVLLFELFQRTHLILLFLYLRLRRYIALVLFVCLWVNFFVNSVSQSETETTIRIWKRRYMYA